MDWSKLMQDVKDNSAKDDRSKIYRDKSVKSTTGPRGDGSVNIGRGVRGKCSLSPILFNLYSEYLTNEAIERYGTWKYDT